MSWEEKLKQSQKVIEGHQQLLGEHGASLKSSSGVRHTQCGVNCFILDSRRVLAPAPKVLGPKHISNPDFAPF